MNYLINYDKIIVAFKMTVNHQIELNNQIKNKLLKSSLQFNFENDGLHHRNYSSTIRVLKNNFPIGHFFMNSKLKFNREIVLFQFCNHSLYQSDFDILKFLTELELEIGAKINNINRLEICYDTVDDLFKKYQSIKTNCEKDENFTKKFAKNFFVNEECKSIFNSSTYLGVKIYGKSTEIVKSHKNYIKEFWEKKGLDHKNQNITRFEVSLSSKFLGRKYPNWSAFDVIKNIETILHNIILSEFRTKTGETKGLFFDFVPAVKKNDQDKEVFEFYSSHYRSKQGQISNTSVFKNAVHTYLDNGSDESVRFIKYTIKSPEINFNTLNTTFEQHRGFGNHLNDRKVYITDLFNKVKKIEELESQFLESHPNSP